MNGPARKPSLPGGVARHIVHGEDRIARKQLKQTLFDHFTGAAQAFFRRLEDHVQGAAEAPGVSQYPGRCQQRCGVTVMAAGVHLAGLGAGVFQAGFLGNWQRIHVGP